MKTLSRAMSVCATACRSAVAIFLVTGGFAGLSHEAAAQPQPPEIVELARALKNSPDLIYEYVYNNIETLPQYGSLKGSLGTLLDGKGTAFDQAELMIALLRQAGVPANFVTGEVEIQAAQLTNWLGIDNSRGSVEVTLGTGGFSGSVDPPAGGPVSSVTIGWAWVQAYIDGTNYVFDPATKSYDRSSGLTAAALAAALGYDRPTFVAGALAGSTAGFASLAGVNRSSIRNNLSAYASSLVQYLRTTNPATTTAEAIGGASIVPLPTGTQLRQTALPAQVGAATVHSALPSNLRTTLTLQLGSNDPTTGNFSALSCTGVSPSCTVTYNSSDIYGKRIIASFNGSSVPSLLVDGVAQLTATSTVPAGRRLTIRTSIVHAYAQPFANIINNDQLRVQPVADRIYLIGTGWGQLGRGMIEKHRELLQQNTAQNPGNPNAEPVMGETLAMLGYTWLAEVSRQHQLVDQIGGTTTVFHHAVGIVGTKSVASSTGPFVDLPLNSVGITQRVGRPIPGPTFTSTPSEAAAFFCMVNFLSVAESGTIEQTQPGALAASTVKLFDTTAQAGGQIFDINNSLIPGDNSAYYYSTIRPILVQGLYRTEDLQRIDSIVNLGLRVVAPANGSLVIGQYNGAGYFQVTQDGQAIGAIITGGLSGGEPASPVPPPQLVQNTRTSATPTPTQSTVISNPALRSRGNAGGLVGQTEITMEPINLVTGDYLLSTSDLVVGSLDFPYGLSFQRYYDSGTRLQDGPLGLGWTHNFAVTASVRTDAFEGLAINSPVNGAAAIAATLVTFDIFNESATTNKPLDRMIIASIVQNWLMDLLKENIVAVTQPGAVQSFTKLADNSYNAPLGIGAKLSLAGGAYVYTAKDGTALSFDPAGNLSTWTNPAGAQVSLGYGGAPAQLATITSNVGRSLALTYAGTRLTRVTDDSGRSVLYSYDGNGNLTGFLDATNSQTVYTYWLPGQLAQIFYPDGVGAFVTNIYDQLGRVRTQVNANGAAWQYFFAGSRSEEVDPLGTEHVLYATPRGRTRLDIRDYSNQRLVTASTHDGLDRLTSTTLPEGGTIAYSYDAAVNAWANNLASVTRHPKLGASPPPPLVTSFTYETTFNKPTQIIDPRGIATVLEYDPWNGNLLSTVADAAMLRATTRYTYNAVGLVTAITDPVGTVTRLDYDAVGNLRTVAADAGPGGASLVAAFGYNAQGDVTSVTDPRGNVTTGSYDEARRPLTTTQPAATSGAAALTTANTWDGQGRLLQVRQSAGGSVLRTTSATYTPTGKPATATDANGNVTRFAYDALDRSSRITDAMGRVTQFTYTVLSQPFRTYNPAVSANPLLEQTYTDDGLLASLKDANGNTTAFAYDRFDRLATTTYPLGSTEAFTYDANGNVLSRTTRAGDTIAFAYDGLNRLTSKTPPSGPAVTYGYDLAGRPTSVSDTSAAIPSVAMPPSTTTYATSYAYDALNRLAGATWDPASTATAPAPGELVTFGHSYNAVNQRVGQTVSDNTWLGYPSGTGTAAYTANALNQYTAVGAASPTYDGNGNLTSDGSYTYGYDPENRLLTATLGGSTATYAYDAQGRRKSRTVNGTTTISVTDADNREVLEYDGSTGTVLRWYSYAPGPNAVLNQMNVSAGTRTTLLPDMLGSIIGSFDSSTGALTKFGYQPYGKSAAAATPFGFTGQRFDSESGLYYYRARHYSTAWGRFLQADPIGYSSGPHLYAYVGNDPLNATDPMGLWVETAWDILNISLGTASLVSNIRSENWGWAAVDAIGLAYDTTAAAVPFLPAGASAGLKSLRAGNSIGTSLTISADTIAVANVAHRVTTVAPTTVNAAVQGTRYHTEVGRALEASGSLSASARNAFTGSRRAAGGPDLSWSGTGVWADLTTAGQWSSHLRRYEELGVGVPFIYTRGGGVSGGLSTGAGASLTGIQAGFGVGEAQGASSGK